MNKYIYYIKYLIKHKWYVFLECWHLGIPWLGIVHDFSKLRWSELVPYARHFGGNIQRGRDKTGYYKAGAGGDRDFDVAWLYHLHRNKHHHQYWCLTQDDDPNMVLKMPYKYMLEMVADWRGAGKAQGTPDTKVWYLAHRERMRLHPVTRVEVEYLLDIVDE